MQARHKLISVGVGVLAAALLTAASDAFAQTPVCNDMPATGQRIECMEDASSTDDIVIDAADVSISTTGQETHGIHASHQGQGDIHFTVRGGSISTADTDSRGVFGVVDADALGSISVEIENAAVETMGTNARAVGAANRGTGSVDVRIRDSKIESTAEDSWGVQASVAGAGDVQLSVSTGTEVSTSGDDADGLVAFATGTADVPSLIDVVVRDSTVTTSGNSAFGLFVQHGRNRGEGAGPIMVDLSNATVVTKGASSHAAYADQRSTTGVGKVMVVLNGGRLVTEGTDDDPNDGTDTFSFGILARQYGIGDVVIDVRDAGVTTRGSSSHGVYGIHSFGSVKSNEGDVFINVQDGSTISTEGRTAHAVVGYHLGTLDSRAIMINVDESTVVARGEGADAIRVGRLDSNGEVERSAALGADGYRRQTVRVNGRVMGGAGHNAAGIHLAGGGRVIIGPQSSVGATSGIAILADGDNVVDGETLVRELRVDLLLDGGPVSDLLDGIVMNDDGETVFAVNGVVLYDDGADGATGLWAPNGARDARLRDGFTELDFSSPDAFMDQYAPRAAVYEALPGFLMRVAGPVGAGAGDGQMHSAETPVWIRFSGRAGAYEAERSAVWAGYDFDRLAVEAGTEFRLDEGLIGSVGLQAVSGSADVSAPTGGGTIDASGHGLSLGLAWDGAEGYYGTGRIAATWLDVDMESNTRGSLVTDVGSFVRALDLEAGRRFALSEATKVTSRAWLSRSDASVNRFRDAVGTRVSVGDANRLLGGLGGIVWWPSGRDDGGHAMARGSLGRWRPLF